MARPRKTGLDYFPVVTEFDVPFRSVKQAFGAEAVSVWITIMQAMYRSGSPSIEITNALILAGLAAESCVTPDRFRVITESFAAVGIYDAKLYELGTICSHGARKQIGLVRGTRGKGRDRAAKSHETKGVTWENSSEKKGEEQNSSPKYTPKVNKSKSKVKQKEKEKSGETPPLSPKGDGPDSSIDPPEEHSAAKNVEESSDVPRGTLVTPPPALPPVEVLLVPKALADVFGFEATWGEWEHFRRKKRKPLDNDMREKQWTLLAQQPDPVAVIEESLRNGYQGLFPLKKAPSFAPTGFGGGGAASGMDQSEVLRQRARERILEEQRKRELAEKERPGVPMPDFVAEQMKNLLAKTTVAPLTEQEKKDV